MCSPAENGNFAYRFLIVKVLISAFSEFCVVWYFVDPSLPPSLLPLRHGGFSDVIMMGRVTCHETVTSVTRLVLFTQSIGRAYPQSPEGIGAHAGNGKMLRYNPVLLELVQYRSSHYMHWMNIHDIISCNQEQDSTEVSKGIEQTLL